MKIRSFSNFLLIILVLCLSQRLIANGYHQILIDRYFSPYTSGQDFLTAADFLTWSEDKLIVPKEPPRIDLMSMSGRLIEMTAFTLISEAINTTQHEVFGHGYRLRTFDSEKAGTVGFSLFNPTVRCGTTHYYYNPNKLNLAEYNSVTVAGIEAQMILGKQIKKQWLQRNHIEPRLNALYISNQQAFFQYATTIRKGGVETSRALRDGNDIRSFIAGINLLYPKKSLSNNKVKLLSALSLLDPMTI